MATTHQLNLALHPGQRAVFDSPARFRVVVAGRRFGKSWLAVVEAIVAAMDERNVQKSPVFLIAPTYPAARTIYWRRLHDMAGPLVVNSNVNLGVVELLNGVEIHIKGADRPDSLRGVGLWFAVVDEYADQKPEVFELIVGPALTDATRYGGGRCLFIGTPKGRNHFYTLVQQAEADTSGLWQVFRFTTADNPFIPRKTIDAEAARMATAAFRQEFLASFESSGEAVFKRDWLREAPGPAATDARYYVTVDLNGFTGTERSALTRMSRQDETAICVVAVMKDRWHVAHMDMGRWDVRETAKRIVDVLVKYRPVALGIERGALKNAVEPYLREEMQRRNAMLSITTLTHNNQEKVRRIVWALQGRLEHGRITFEAGAPWLEKLFDQLVQFPNSAVNDDGPDALAYVDQLVKTVLWDGWEGADTWQPLDEVAGY